MEQKFFFRTLYVLIFCMTSYFFQTENNSVSAFTYPATDIAEEEYLHRYYWAIGGGLHTQGVLFNTYFVKKTDFWKGWIAEISFGWMHDFKEIYIIKVSSKYADAFVYGKKNFMFFNRFSFGGWQTFFEKYRNKGVEISLRYEGGLNLAYLKPIFVKVIDDNDHHKVVNQMYDENKHPYGSILGSASGFLGVPYTKVKPGMHAKTALNFDWFKPKRKNTVGAFELGLIIDGYPQGVEIMAFQPLNYVFFTGYFILVFGKKF